MEVRKAIFFSQLSKVISIFIKYFRKIWLIQTKMFKYLLYIMLKSIVK